ncbi:MAG TPA: orotidine-5'-phosphate decarboxylase [Trueperaceae bacterium]
MSAVASPGEPYSRRVTERQARLGTRVCLGLDPRPAAHPLTDPARLGASSPRDPRVVTAVGRYLAAVLEATADLIAACKPQAAFFEALGPAGSGLLAEVVALARDLGVPVVLDAKRGDIGTTAEAYAEAYLGDGPLAADALTVSPYLGLDTLEPFLAAAVRGGRGLYVLVRTSNPGSRDLQGLALAGGGTVASRLAARLADMAAGMDADEDGYTALGAVAAAPEDLAELRAALPRSPLLVPGYGAQGARGADVVDAFDARGHGALVSASRSLTNGSGFETAVSLDEVAAMARSSAAAMRGDIEAALAARAAGGRGGG